MDSVGDDAKAPGCPIRISSDQRLLPPPRSFSQGATSFIVSRCQGIHQMPLSCLRAASMRRDKAHAHERHSLKASLRPESFPAVQNDALCCYSRSTLPGSIPAGCKKADMDRWYPPAIPSSRTTEGQNPIHDVKEPNAKKQTLPAKHIPRSGSRLATRSASREGWWSRTGSNRRPPACKAGALPTELRPRSQAWRAWWAREDLNFRPHAYQARALTS